MRNIHFLLHRDLDDVRDELLENISQIKDEELEYAPAEGMRTLRGMLIEIGSTELDCLSWLRDRVYVDFNDLAGQIATDDSTVEEIIAKLKEVRAETVAYIDSVTSDELLTPAPMPERWHAYYGEVLEPSELIRWLNRHEYYHLGQIISYRWAQGYDPYAS